MFINIRKYWWLLVALGILIGIVLAIPAVAQSPQHEYIQETISTTTPPGITGRGNDRPVPVPTVHRTENQTSPSGQYRTYTKEEVVELITNYSILYGIDPNLPLRVAQCESGFNQFAKNSGSTASGVFQYIHSTWIHTDAGKDGLSPFDADANIHMAIKSIASGGIGNWTASRGCWHG